MCMIEGPVDFMIGMRDEWSKGLAPSLVEELEAQFRQKIQGELAGSDIGWSLSRDALQDLPEELANADELPASAHTHFIECALAEFNDQQAVGEHIWFDAAAPDESETCCYWQKHIWRPCSMVMLNRGPGKDRDKERWTIELEHPDLKAPIQVQLMAKVEWALRLEEPDGDSEMREKITEILPQAKGDVLEQALAILQGASA